MRRPVVFGRVGSSLCVSIPKSRRRNVFIPYSPSLGALLLPRGAGVARSMQEGSSSQSAFLPIDLSSALRQISRRPSTGACRLHLRSHNGTVLITDPSHFVALGAVRSEEHTSELPSLMRISYPVF